MVKPQGRGIPKISSPLRSKVEGWLFWECPCPGALPRIKTIANKFFKNITVIPSTGYHNKTFLNLKKHRVN
jgi:hypothetical protein